MQLDFTGLDKIAFTDFTEATETPQDAPQPKGGIDTPPGEKMQDGQLQRAADQRKQALKSAADVYKRYQDNIRATELLQAEILKGVKAGEDLRPLFLKAVKALSLTVNCDLLYTQAAAALAENYPEAAEKGPGDND